MLFNVVCTLLFCFGTQTKKKTKRPKKTSQWRSMIGWNIGFVGCFLWFGFESRRAKCRQDWKNRLCSMMLPMKTRIYIYIHTYIGRFDLWQEKWCLNKKHVRKKRTPTIPVLKKSRCLKTCKILPTLVQSFTSTLIRSCTTVSKMIRKIMSAKQLILRNFGYAELLGPNN